MTRRFALYAFLLSLFSPALFAQLVITSVSPSSGPTTGGTTVTIKGEFGSWPYGILFGSVPALSSQRIDANTIVAVTPPHLPGPSPIVVFEYDILLGTTGSFTFEGPVPEPEFERVLVPLLTPPVFGAFGSEFHTDLRLMSKNLNQSIPVFGLNPPCTHPNIPNPICIWDPANDAMHVQPNGDLGPEEFDYSGTPGRFIYVQKAHAEGLAGNLRVHDVSRASLNFGTEIPLVRARDMEELSIVLPGVPTGPGFRNTMRIYGTAGMRIMVTVQGRDPVVVGLPQPANEFDPAYAVFTDFPVGEGTVWVRLEALPAATGPSPPVYFGHFWAFITVTNNETQAISTITPQP